MFFLTIWLGKRNQNKGRGRNDDEKAKRTKNSRRENPTDSLALSKGLVKALPVGWLAFKRPFWHPMMTLRKDLLSPSKYSLSLAFYILLFQNVFCLSLSLSRLFSSSYFILFLTLLSVCFTVFRLHRLFVLPLVCDSGYAYFWPLDFVSYNV